jgi:beta-lactamase class C
VQVASAGYLMGVVGTPNGEGTWEDLVQARIFTPLQMTRTCANFSQCVSKPNRATPMRFDLSAGKWRDLPYELNYIIDQSAPCGAVVSSANDMAKWALAHLGHAQHVFNNATLARLHAPKTTYPDSTRMPSWLYNRAYGSAYAYNCQSKNECANHSSHHCALLEGGLLHCHSP